MTRICLFDTLLERHVADSLERALRARGHDVFATGPVWHGWRMPRSVPEVDQLAAAVDDLIASAPDVVVVLRPSALRPEQVDRLRERGIVTCVWFSDDPVMYRPQGARVAAHYDVTLHTATAPVLQFYEDELGVRGFGFPFWTDDVAFPRRYDPAACDLDVVFIGNTQTRAKAPRYDWIAALPLEKAIYGVVAADPAGIHAGTAADDDELGRAAVRGRLGLNIAQRFAEYAGTQFDYPQLASFGEFSLASRVVQLAALGVPTVSYVAGDGAADDTAVLFPPVWTVRDGGELVELAHAVRHDHDRLRAASDAMHAWYRQHYTAGERARFLEALLADLPRWQALDASRRALAFMHADDPPPAPRRRWPAAVSRLATRAGHPRPSV